MDKKNVHSRAYHVAKNAALREGATEEVAKQRAREAAGRAVAAMED